MTNSFIHILEDGKKIKVSWRNIFNTRLRFWAMDKAFDYAKECNYPLVNWNEIIYETISGRRTMITSEMVDGYEQ